MIRSKEFVLCSLTLLMLGALALPASAGTGANFVYTNDDISGPNTVSGFSVATNGALTLLTGSPFLTGGTGGGGGYYAANRATAHTDGNFIFASNTISNDVSVFEINTKTGTLSLVPGSPFAMQSPGDGLGISLAATPNGMFLIAAGGATSLTVFSIASSGALTPIAGSPFAVLSETDGIKVSPNGKFLAVAEVNADQIEMFSIAANGSLTSLGAFHQTGVGEIAGVDINCFTTLLYGGEAGSSTIIDGYSISSKGTLTTLPGSPFEPGMGINSNVVLLGYGLGRTTLFVSNQASNTITAFSVAPKGGLSPVTGSPFRMKSRAYGPTGMATSQDGHLLYVANITSMVSVFSVGNGGALTEAPGSPFPTGQQPFSGLGSITAFPSNQLSMTEAGCPANP